MNIFGIGPMELIFIGILLLIIFGPKDLQKAGKSVGRALRKIVRSDTWKTVQQTSKNIRQLPNELIREADLEEIKKSFAQTSAEIGSVAPVKPETTSSEKTQLRDASVTQNEVESEEEPKGP
jgi:Sec-independent protein translocase protein TatA